MLVTECATGFSIFLNDKSEHGHRSAGQYVVSNLNYNDKMKRLVNLIYRNHAYVLPRIYQLCFTNFESVQHLPLDSRSHQSAQNSIMGIIRVELSTGAAQEMQIPSDKTHEIIPGYPQNLYFAFRICGP